jgi:predicted ribosomally synthesized peptide with SipW-like signal peptide
LNANDPLTPDAQLKKQDRARKRKAILAGGVVLGLGAAITLAAWSDDVFADGLFNTGSFDLIGSPGTTATLAEGAYAQYDTSAGAADLSFEIDALEMYPGETVAAPFSIAQPTGTDVDGRVWMYEATATGVLAPHLSYAIKSVADPTACLADDPATTVDESAAVTALPAWNDGAFTTNPVQNLAGQRDAAGGAETQDLLVEQNFGNQQHLCIQVTLEDNETAIGALDTSVDTSILWQFKGESETPTA